MIDVYTFEPVQTPQVLGVIDGETKVPNVWPQMVSAERVLDQDLQDFSEIPYIFRNYGAEGHLFYHLDESGDIYDLDTATGAFQ